MKRSIAVARYRIFIQRRPVCALPTGSCLVLSVSGSDCLFGLRFPNHGLGNHHHAPFHTTSFQSAYQLRKNLKDCYQVLNVDPENSNVSDVKEAFLKLAKQYHPDGRTTTADVRRFNQVEEAYRAIRAHLEATTSDSAGEKRQDGLEFDIEHTAPQHRQYLEFEGIGTGTPSQRHNHYQKFRVQRAMNSVSERRWEKSVADAEGSALVNLDKKAARKIKTTNLIERLVEDLIQDAMSKGEFENLPNSGKPLPDKTSTCPYWDVGEHNLNQVLVNNGYAPEWIQAEREIRSELLDLKDALLRARLKLGPEPLNPYNRDKWESLREEFADSLRTLNKRVERRNLIVPLLRLQIVNFRPLREIDKVVKEYEERERARIVESDESRRSVTNSKQTEGLFNFDTDGHFLSKIGDKIFQKLFFDKGKIEN